jgi:hydroxyacylglutathione hydrolase
MKMFTSPLGSIMLQRKYLFPRVIEMNYQAGRRLGVNVYLIDGGSEYLLIDIGFEDTVFRPAR